MGKGLANKIVDLKHAERKKKTDFVLLERGFYREVMRELEDMQIEIKRLVDRGEYDKVAEITEELTRARKAMEEFLDVRLRKILNATLSPSINIKNLTRDERQLYADVKALVDSFRARIFGEEEIVEESTQTIETPAASEEEKKTETTGKVGVGKQERYVLVRVLGDVKIALPSGRDMFLRKEDVLHLPEKIYRILLKRDKVEEILA